MLDEGDDLEAIYVCVKFTLTCESLSTVPRDSPRLTNKRKIYTYVMGLENRNTPIRVQAGAKNSRPVGFLR
jgi:adenylosuccinate synthase